MSKILNLATPLPVAEKVEDLMDIVTDTFSAQFRFIQSNGEDLMDLVTSGLTAIPPYVFILIIAVLAFFATGKKIRLSHLFYHWFTVHIKPGLMESAYEYIYTRAVF